MVTHARLSVTPARSLALRDDDVPFNQDFLDMLKLVLLLSVASNETCFINGRVRDEQHNTLGRLKCCQSA